MPPYQVERSILVTHQNVYNRLLAHCVSPERWIPALAGMTGDGGEVGGKDVLLVDAGFRLSPE